MKLQFKHITTEVFEQLKGEMTKIGIDISGNSGDISAKGVEGTFARNPDDETLEINIQKTPFILPKKLVASKIENAVTKIGGAVIS